MVPLVYVIVSLVITSVSTKPTADSTHEILEKLGFEKLNKPTVNHHKKRLATETHKARYSIDDYNTETDSDMFVVKLPPHSPYYSPTIPEKLDKARNHIVTKPPIHFRTNGKPSKVYHWNVPVLKKILQNKYRTHYKKNDIQDSKIYNVKILNGDKTHYELHPKMENEVRYQKHKKRNDVNSREYLNDMTIIKKHDSVKQKHNETHRHKEHILSIKELAEKEYQHLNEKRKNEVTDTDITKIIMDHQMYKHKSKKYKKTENPSVYSPALPKQNSFYKYFPGNGKPKSFYVIEKSKTPTRYHRLL